MTSCDLVLHVGMPRSAFVLRPALGRLRPQLHAHGVAFVGHDLAGRPVARPGESRRAGEVASEAEFPAVVAERVAEQVRHAAGRRPTVVVSSDRLLGGPGGGQRDTAQFRPDAVRTVERVVAAVAARNVRVVLHPERQDRLLEAAYARAVAAGERVGVEAFLAEHSSGLDYGGLADRLGAATGVDEVMVRPGELADAGALAFVDDFLGLVGLGRRLDLYAVGADLRAHPLLYSSQGVALALAMGPLLDTPAEHTLLHAYLAANFSTGECNLTDILTKEQRAQLLVSYEAANRDLFAHRMPALPQDSYADDVATFGLGNELTQPRRGAPPAIAPQPPGPGAVERFDRLLARISARVSRLRSR